MKSKILILLILPLIICCHDLEQKLVAPLDKGIITSTFGGRYGRIHFGIDIAAPKGTPIITMGDGIVTNVRRRNKVFGNRVDVYHPKLGVYSSYSHLSKVNIIKGEIIRKGTMIGLVGSTGKSTGPHLHLEVYNINKVYINPLSLLETHPWTFRKDVIEKLAMAGI